MNYKVAALTHNGYFRQQLADTSITEFLMREIPNFPNVSLILISSKYFWSPKGFNLWLIHRQKSDAQRTTMNMFL